jgi:hypothetical protein
MYTLPRGARLTMINRARYCRGLYIAGAWRIQRLAALTFQIKTADSFTGLAAIRGMNDVRYG